MTICVAARCAGNVIFGASDRLLTGGDVEFEPDIAKIIPLTTSIVAMTAGDSSFQVEIIQEINLFLAKEIAKSPDKWLSVRDVAYEYLHCRNEIKRKRAEEALLRPIGLDQNSFLARQHELSDGFISKLTKELVNFEVPSVSTILAGRDESGAHIYTIDDAMVRCHDSVGFAAIGSGYWHANSQFMLARHNYDSVIADGLLLTYVAKRRAEVAPGVGKGTDMFMVGPQLGSYVRLRDEILQQLDKTYTKMIREESKSLETGRKEIQQYVAKLTKAAEAAAAAKEQTTPKIDGGDKTPDGGTVPDDSKKEGQ